MDISNLDEATLKQIIAAAAANQQSAAAPEKAKEEDKPWHATTGGKVAIGAGGTALGVGGTLLVQHLASKPAEETVNAVAGGLASSALDLLGG